MFSVWTSPTAYLFAGRHKRRHELEAATAGAWVALARNGNPNHAGLPNWPAFTADKRATMIFDVPCRVEDDPTEEVREIMEHRTA
jgi:para-nitrobenzyl esterase